MKRTYVELMQELEEKWTVENVTALLDEMNIEYELVDEEGETKVSINEMKEQKEITYRLRHKATGQYVSYLGVVDYHEDVMIPEKIDAIEFTDLKSEAEEFFFEWEDNDLDIVPQLSLNRLELYYTQFFLEIEKIEEDEKYLFYSEDLDTYFDYIDIDTTLNGATSFRLDSVPSVSTYNLKNSGTNDKEIIELFEQNTNFHKVKVSDIE